MAQTKDHVPQRGRLALLMAAVLWPLAATANNKGKKRVGGRGSSGKGGRYVKGRR